MQARDLHFTFTDIPRYWHPRGRAVTLFFDGMSILFPRGEQFFVKSMKGYIRSIGDAQLRAAIRVFCAQESFHAREHVAYNRRLREHGYPVDRLEDAVQELLNRVARRSGKRVRLAVTASLEHFTTILAHAALSNSELLEGADPRMLAFWRWHALEETEHRTVAFDVYLAAGGTYTERVAIMLMTSAGFIAKVMEHQLCLMQADGCLFDAREWVSWLRLLTVLVGPELVTNYCAWYRLDFHPSDLALPRALLHDADAAASTL